MYSTKVPKELVFQICDHLSAWDALNLRQTCRSLNRAVVEHQTFWYRCFTWYLIKQNKRVALYKTGCKRHHKTDIEPSVRCLTSDQESDLADELDISISNLSDYLEKNADTITPEQCQNPLHFVYEVPKKLSDIPIVPEDFHPTEQVYLYRYLIHNYRTRRDKIKRYTAEDIKEQRRATIIALKRAQAAVEKHQRKLKTLLSITTEMRLLERNKVFFGSKSRQYRGLTLRDR